MAACRLSPAARELMEHPAGGWCGVVRNGLLDLDDLSLPPLPDARALEAGSHGFLAQVGWKAAVELLGKGTVVQREQRILGLGRRLIDGLSSLPGVELASCDDDAHRSGITCLRHADGAALHQGLAERNIAVSLRLGLLRVAPHCWSTEEEIDLVLSTLAELLE
ncbi:MAG: aminotransferase class V-fold PLP-dependent enzyme [Acidobacteriota bacterium]